MFLHQYWGDDTVLLLSLPQESNVIHMIEKYIENIKANINEHFFAYDKEDEESFQTGYIVMDAYTDHPFQSILITYQKALVMAKKGVGSKYNQMVHEIKEIIEKENFSLYSQPIVNVHELDVMAWEVLTRGPEHTVYEHPLQLFSMARQTNMLYTLELLVIKKNLQKMRGQDAIFINVTPQTIAHKHFIDDVDEILQNHVHINPSQIFLK
ncbi:EAL domain-containing protein [Pseudalkalibacillus sp. A8]|uniref:EAL domain-containing protein n=1 Tax=Pseudalkalibacillus sp. A8 TaxID=3382641 RepID=UPI0038B53165